VTELVADLAVYETMYGVIWITDQKRWRSV